MGGRVLLRQGYGETRGGGWGGSAAADGSWKRKSTSRRKSKRTGLCGGWHRPKNEGLSRTNISLDDIFCLGFVGICDKVGEFFENMVDG